MLRDAPRVTLRSAERSEARLEGDAALLSMTLYVSQIPTIVTKAPKTIPPTTSLNE